MLGFKKLRSIFDKKKKYKKIHIDILRENQRFEQDLLCERKQLKTKNKELTDKLDTAIQHNTILVDENRELKKTIEELEGDQERWNMLDL